MGCKHYRRGIFRENLLEIDCLSRADWPSYSEWNNYIKNLKSCYIELKEEEANSLVWARNEKTGNYTVKLGYLSQAKDTFEGEKNGGGRMCGNHMLL
jgi:hypothetical protein